MSRLNAQTVLTKNSVHCSCNRASNVNPKGDSMAHAKGWLCDVCSKEYTAQADAEDCELRHMIASLGYSRYREGEAYPYELVIIMDGDYHSETYVIPFTKG